MSRMTYILTLAFPGALVIMSEGLDDEVHIILCSYYSEYF